MSRPHDQHDPHQVTSVEALEALYGEPSPAAVHKELDHIHPHYRAMIEAAPFVALASCGPDGLDVTPRGDAPGFVRIADERTLMLPDRRGNNRIDSLRNLVADPRVALLFLMPGIGETLRVNGRATISIDPALCESFAVKGQTPRSVLVVSVERVYFQCTKAIVRSRLWDPCVQLPRTALPSTGKMIEAFSRGAIEGAAYDAAAPQRIKDTLY